VIVEDLRFVGTDHASSLARISPVCANPARRRGLIGT
jgi:hypothetical protein